MRDCHVTNTRFRSGFPFCLCAHAHMHIPYRQLHSSWTLDRPAVDIRSRHSSHYQWEVKRIHLGPKQIVLSLGAVLLSEVCSLRPKQPPWLLRGQRPIEQLGSWESRNKNACLLRLHSCYTAARTRANGNFCSLYYNGTDSMIPESVGDSVFRPSLDVTWFVSYKRSDWLTRFSNMLTQHNQEILRKRPDSLFGRVHVRVWVRD